MRFVTAHYQFLYKLFYIIVIYITNEFPILETLPMSHFHSVNQFDRNSFLLLTLNVLNESFNQSYIILLFIICCRRLTNKFLSSLVSQLVIFYFIVNKFIFQKYRSGIMRLVTNFILILLFHGDPGLVPHKWHIGIRH